MKLIGAHVSSAGGTDKAMARVAAIGGNCVQVFSGSPRSWGRPALSDYDQVAIADEQAKNGVKKTFTHALYLINLASDNPELQQKSIKALRHDLGFDSLVKGSGVVVHLGSHQKRSWEADREGLVKNILEVLKDTPDDSTFLIENSAGQKGKIASDLEHVKWLLEEVGRELGQEKQAKRLGWCFDTCHGFAAGYSLGQKKLETGEDSKNESRGRVVEEIERLNLWESLKVVHVNGSRDPFASGRDRHANFGEGTLTDQDLKTFLHHPQIAKMPLITEVPGFDGKGPDQKNMKMLQTLAKS